MVEFYKIFRWIFATDFLNARGIRSLVPCFDEPYFKAPWQITLEHPSDMVPLSNAISNGTILGNNGVEKKLDIFSK